MTCYWHKRHFALFSLYKFSCLLIRSVSPFPLRCPRSSFIFAFPLGSSFYSFSFSLAWSHSGAAVMTMPSMWGVTRITSPSVAIRLYIQLYRPSSAIAIALKIFTLTLCISRVIPKRSVRLVPDTCATLLLVPRSNSCGDRVGVVWLSFYVTFEIPIVHTVDCSKRLVQNKVLAPIWVILHGTASRVWPRDPRKFLVFPDLTTEYI